MYNRKVRGSKAVRNFDYFDWHFLWFASVLSNNTVILLRLDHNLYLLNPLLFIIYSSSSLTKAPFSLRCQQRLKTNQQIKNWDISYSMSKNSNKMQQYADIYLLLNYYTCFGRPSRPSSGVHKTLVASSGTDHTIWAASFLKRDQISGEQVFQACSPDNTICTRGCNYSFMYSWSWARWTSETCRVI